MCLIIDNGTIVGFPVDIQFFTTKTAGIQRGQRGERLEGAIETGIPASPGSPWCTNLWAQESLQGSLIDGRRKSASVNPYHLISTEVPSGLTCLRNER